MDLVIEEMQRQHAQIFRAIQALRSASEVAEQELRCALYTATERASGAAKKLWDWLLALEPTNVVKLSDIVSAQDVTSSEAEETIKAALSTGLVEAVFTLRDAEHLVDPITWTTNLLSLKKSFQREDGETVDGSDPTKIVVGFRRVER
jgi:hypothetical protein